MKEGLGWLVMTSLLFFSCHKKEETDNNVEAEILFENSIELIKDYTYQIKNASDSAQIDSLSKTLEKKITEINFSVPPQTDLKLSEEENDSIFKLMKIMKTEQENKLKSFALNPMDSLDNNP